MIYGSVCSGIEAASAAWHPLGWRAAFLSEIEPFPRAVLKHHYPDVPLHGDFTTIERGRYEPIDILVGGTPCQSFSVAGLRGGLGDDRGNLALEYLRLADRLRPNWLVWENVPGVYSSLSHPAPDPCPPPPPVDLECDGAEMETEDEYDSEELHAFQCFLAGLSELGYGFAYRVLDAQFVRTRPFPWAVPQRRRRVFVVGYLGYWRRAAAVLFDAQSLRGDPPPQRYPGQVATPTLNARTRGGGGLGSDLEIEAFIAESPIPFDTTQITSPGNYSNPMPGDPCHPLAAGAHPPSIAFAIQERAVSENPDAGPDGAGIRDDGAAYTLEARTVPQAVAFDCKGSQVQWDASGVAPPLRSMSHSDSHANAGGHAAVAFDLRGREGGSEFEGPHDTANLRAANGGSSRSYVATDWAVRRLTPTECERLQGFRDGYTAIPWRGKPPDQCPDGPRYKALGNSMAVPVMQWIGERIEMVDKLEADP